MKLTDLNPRFTHEAGQKVLVFDCPKDNKPDAYGFCHSFRIPVGEQIKAAPPVWQINSEDLNTLTMRPSVRDLGKCGVHFYITKGQIELLP